MNFIQSGKYIKENNSAAFALNLKMKELVTIIYNTDPEKRSDIIVTYSEEISPFIPVELNYTPEEFAEEYKDCLNDYDFIPCNKDIVELHCCTFESILEKLNDYKLN